MSSGNRVPPALTQPVLSTGPMINDAIREACFAGRIANPRQRCWAGPRGPAGDAYPQHGSDTARLSSYHSAELIGQTREFSATMGSMSASDAAPLPRLGEVFFDVRGDSRSMRLSWYADTGVAVFSIWQGGTCTGTFRLPMDDRARMSEALHRGPQGQRAGRREAPGEAGPEGPAGRSPAGGGPAGRSPGEGQATVAMRMPAGSAPGWAAPGAGLPGRGARRLRDGPGPGLPRGLRRLPGGPARPGLPGARRPVPGRAVDGLIPRPGPGIRHWHGLSRGPRLPGRARPRRLPAGRGDRLPGCARHRRLRRGPVGQPPP